MDGKITFLSILVLFLVNHGLEAAVVFDIRNYGNIKSDGKTDIKQPLLKAWKDACASPSPSAILIPKGKFALTQVMIEGPCKSPIELQIQGTLTASADMSHFQLNGPSPGWIVFYHITDFTISGGGTIDGQGTTTSWSANNCKKNSNCKMLPMNVVMYFVTNTVVHNINSLNSKNFHFAAVGATNLSLQNLQITAPSDSPNTDGIHIGRSIGVTISNCNIKTGDDCISLGDGSKQINITKVTCGPGHGISVGSLGKYEKEEPVQGVYVKNCTLTNTMFGVRIKTWPSNSGSTASDIHFENIRMNNVGNPIIIDQQYCPNGHCSQQAGSRVQISKVSFKNIKGTSATKDAVTLHCSSSLPCKSVELADIDLKYNGQSASSSCLNVKPSITSGRMPLCTGGSGSGSGIQSESVF